MANIVDLEKGLTYNFTVKGKIVLPSGTEELYDSRGEILGFKLPCGAEMLTVLGVEIDEKAILTTDDNLGEYGIQVTDYTETSFEATKNLTEWESMWLDSGKLGWCIDSIHDGKTKPHQLFYKPRGISANGWYIMITNGTVKFGVYHDAIPYITDAEFLPTYTPLQFDSFCEAQEFVLEYR